ncbi:amidase [Arthrobacter echini]|uniref:Amidase n=1 Tax=Arthrobacter echini TaxID=1529066 RepID=A0A5D0XU32_9MICC|nr:amidase [Arthrobacter echini]TYD00178.1 amidase [Arthrobacter echini]
MTGGAALGGVGPFGGTTISTLAARIRSRETSSLEITEVALAAAHKYGPMLNCFVTIDDHGATQAAAVADEELAAGLDRGPLHGIPVGIKDVIATNGLLTTMGSRHFSDHVPTADADVVTALRSAGAVILAKTQTHEFAYGPTSDRSASGPARNPHRLGLMTGGSSGGSAAAVAAGLLPLALGTDTGGSTRVPAALCGTLGLRPTGQSLSSRGVFPLSPTLDVVGPLAATAEDIAIAWRSLSPSGGLFPAAEGTEDPRGLPAAIHAGELRYALVTCALTERASADSADAVRIAAAALTRDRAPVPTVFLPEIDACADPYRVIQSAEAYALHHERVERAPELFGSEVLERLHEASRVAGWEYVLALADKERLRARVLVRLRTADVLLMPTVPVSAPAIDQRSFPPETLWNSPREALLSMTSAWSVLGFPALSVPVPGTGDGLPRSVQVIAKPDQEEQLFIVAAALEESFTAL